NVGGERRLDAVRLGAKLLERRHEQGIDRPELGPAPGWARLEPRQVEQVVDEALEPAQLEPDRLEEFFALFSAEPKRRVVQAFAGSPDRGQRRAEVVADGVQDGRLDRVALAKGLGLDSRTRQSTRARRELADDDADDEVDTECDPVRRIAEFERVERREEQEVED